MSKNCVCPLKRAEIREFALRIRRFLGYKDTDFVDMAKLFDYLSNRFAMGGLKFDYRVMSDDDNSFENKEEAFTDMSSGIIYIKESVMNEACRRSFRRSSFTLAHELGHYLLHYVQDNVRLTRISDNLSVPTFCDPEWQADAFASEFLMPYDQCLKMSVEEIRKTYHVSRKAAEVRYDKIHKN